MIISKIIQSDSIYYNVHAEQTITGSFVLGHSGLRLFENTLTLTTIDNIINDIMRNKYRDNTIIFDFNKIDDCQGNLKDKIVALLDYAKIIAFTNIKLNIVERLGLSIFKEWNTIEGEKYACFCPYNKAIDVSVNSTYEVFDCEFKKVLMKHINSNGSLIVHNSSSVYLTSYIDVKSFIINEKELLIYAIYHLAIKMEKHWREEIANSHNKEKPILICQSLNSSYIASILSRLLKLDVLILDQIGPINKLYRTLNQKIEENRNYIVVSDLVCLGTEVKITKSLIDYLGGKYCGNVSIVRTESILPEDKTLSNIETVFIINKDNYKELNYEIKTALND